MSKIRYADVVSEEDSAEKFRQFMADNVDNSKDSTTGATRIYVLLCNYSHRKYSWLIRKGVFYDFGTRSALECIVGRGETSDAETGDAETGDAGTGKHGTLRNVETLR